MATMLYLDPRQAAMSSTERATSGSTASGFVALTPATTAASIRPSCRAPARTAVATPPDAPAYRVFSSAAQPNHKPSQGPRKSSAGAPLLRPRHQAPGA